MSRDPKAENRGKERSGVNGPFWNPLYFWVLLVNWIVIVDPCSFLILKRNDSG